MFFSLNSSTNDPIENVPLTGGFKKKEISDDEGKKKKDYTPIMHSPFGAKKKQPLVVHSPTQKEYPPVVHSPVTKKPILKKHPKKKVPAKKVEFPAPVELPAPVEPPKPTQKPITLLDGTPLQGSEIKLLKSIVSKWKDYSNKRKDVGDASSKYRKGPAPVDEVGKKKRKFVIRCSHGTLDSDVESIQSDDENADKLKESYASNKGLIMYFAKLAVTSDEKEGIDLKFVDSLVREGADINFPDKYGQTILHEVSRAWHTDVAKFLLARGSKINKGDKFGRTPLHLCAAVGYVEMIEFLVSKGANIHAQTKGEKQTPIHYAARNNSVASLKCLLKLGASITDRDYKARTPLYVAAENGRTEAARLLLEAGAPAAVYDDEGISCLVLMVEKMPAIALEALEQFYTEDRALRKKFYYLSYLEKRLSLEEEEEIALHHLPKSERRKKEKQRKQDIDLEKGKGKKEVAKGELAKSALEAISEFTELELAMHATIQSLIEVKWKLFGKRTCQINVLVSLLYAVLWSFLGIFVPRDHEYYVPLSKFWWRIALEFIGISMTIYFMVTQYLEARDAIRRQAAFKSWHIQQVERDSEHCHPRWPEEKRYLDQELERIKRSKGGKYFANPWNLIDWAIHLVIWVIVITRLMVVYWKNDDIKKNHIRIFALSLVLIWMRLLKVCRAFQSLGPFIALLGHVINDTLKFAFLFFEFFIPYVCAFWMLFGGEKNAKIMSTDGEHTGWSNMNDLIYSVFQINVIGSFDFGALIKVDKIMAQILVGTYIAISAVVCLNLYIALMSDTFARVYQNAKANAMLQQAEQILVAERTLSKWKHIQVRSYITEECAPLEIYTSEEQSKNKGNPGNRMYDRINRHTDTLIDGVKDMIRNLGKEVKHLNKAGPDSSKAIMPARMKEWQEKQDKQMEEMKKTIEDLQSKQDEMFHYLKANLFSDEYEDIES